MAYHTAAQLPVYDYLAANFYVCDHWFCSLPGETMRTAATQWPAPRGVGWRR